MIYELPHVWPLFLVQMYFKKSNRTFRPRWGRWGGSCTCRRVLCYPMPLRPPVPEQKHPDKPCHLVLRPWFREGRGAADKTHWVSGQLLNEADS